MPDEMTVCNESEVHIPGRSFKTPAWFFFIQRTHPVGGRRHRGKYKGLALQMDAVTGENTKYSLCRWTPSQGKTGSAPVQRPGSPNRS